MPFTTLLSASAERIALALLMLSAFADPASAQIQRSFLNLSFEAPPLPSADCWSIRVSEEYETDPQYMVPGWRTTEKELPGSWVATSYGSCGGHPAVPPPAGSIQMFKNSFGGVSAPEGTQWAELNAYTGGKRIYQEVCLIEGDEFNWRFY